MFRPELIPAEQLLLDEPNEWLGGPYEIKGHIPDGCEINVTGGRLTIHGNIGAHCKINVTGGHLTVHGNVGDDCTIKVVDSKTERVIEHAYMMGHGSVGDECDIAVRGNFTAKNIGEQTHVRCGHTLDVHGVGQETSLISDWHDVWVHGDVHSLATIEATRYDVHIDGTVHPSATVRYGRANYAKDKIEGEQIVLRKTPIYANPHEMGCGITYGHKDASLGEMNSYCIPPALLDEPRFMRVLAILKKEHVSMVQSRVEGGPLFIEPKGFAQSMLVQTQVTQYIAQQTKQQKSR